MSDIIQNLMNSVLEDGARTTKFKCQVMIPESLKPNDYSLDVICKSAVVPNKTNSEIMVKYKGRNIPVIGQESFSNSLELSFYLEEDHRTKILFHDWLQSLNKDSYSAQEDIDSKTKSLKRLQNNNITAARRDIILTQLDFTGTQDRVQYILRDCFPKEITQIQYNSETVGSLLDFSVTFIFSYFDIRHLSDPTQVGKITQSQTSQPNPSEGYNPQTTYTEPYSETYQTFTEVQDNGLSVGPDLGDFMDDF